MEKKQIQYEFTFVLPYHIPTFQKKLKLVL